MNISITKLALLLILMMATCLSALPNLNMHIDSHRYLDKEGNTILLVTYQIPYREMLFLSQQGGFMAQMDVTFEVSNQDSVIFTQNITDNVGVRSKYDAASSQKHYLNRVSYRLESGAYNILMVAIDKNSGRSFRWTFPVQTLERNARISDIELNAKVFADSSSYLQKFRRQNLVYEPVPSAILFKDYSDFAHLYLELYTPITELNQNKLLVLSLERDSTMVLDEYIDTTPTQETTGISLKIPLKDLRGGKYRGTISLQGDDNLVYRDFDLFISEEVEQRFHLFPNQDDEYALMRYFMGSKLSGNWENLNSEDKARQITGFWKNMASSTGMSVDGILDLIHERVEYANKYFSHLKQGWTTDMGRIYIRNGAPADIEKGTSSDQSRFVRKDYQIWKYSSGNKPVYMFVDMQMNNNFRLIYATDDDMESTNPNWIGYVGSDFDETLLRN